jgi:acetylornithine deacetylase/succinyl-diaminopimelate desuccinylase-like protein
LFYKSNSERRQIIVKCLKEYGVDYRTQNYGTGVNLVVDLGGARERIGIGSHFDRVPEAPGANDNGSAMAACLDVISRFQEKGE